MNNTPVCPFAVFGLLMAGATLNVTAWVSDPVPFVALRLATYGLPAALVGVPDTTPVPAATFKPGGSDPENRL